MKEKDIEGEQLEKLSNELFGAFDSHDEACLVGGNNITKTVVGTFSPNGTDAHFDLDDWYTEE